MVGLILTVFAHHNSFYISINLWPFDYHMTVIFPLVVMAVLVLGLIMGGCLMVGRKKKTTGYPLSIE